MSKAKVDKVPTADVVGKSRNIGIDIVPPEEVCDDVNCPFHGSLKVRGFSLVGEIVSEKMDKSVVVKKERLYYLKKYERYEKRTSKMHAHLPPCIDARAGDKVRIVECRPISKTISFVVIGKVK